MRPHACAIFDHAFLAEPEMTDRRITRRELLEQGVNLAALGAALPALSPRRLRRETSAMPDHASNSVMPALSAYMAAAGARELPSDAAEHTKLHLLDTVAAMVSGTTLPPGRAALAFARAYGGSPAATVVGSRIELGAIDAALLNAMMAHADETDDSHAPSESHPGCSIVPAALAAGEQFRIDGNRLLRAVALGYDIGTRLTMTLGARNFEVGNHLSSHAFAGIWGSAAAAGCAANLDARRMAWLLAYAADQSSGLTVWQRDTDHIQKAFAFAGVGARNGVSAALMVHAGWTGVDDVLSGSYNFFAAYAPEAAPAGLVDALGTRYEVTRTNIKKWSVGSPIQAPLDALENLQRKRSLDVSRIREVVVRVATEEANLVDNREMPDICLQHMVAVMLVDHTVTFRSAHDKPRMQDPAILRARAKVRLVRDQALERLLPKRVAIVEVHFADGTEATERVDAVRGTAQNPMTREEVVAKAHDLMAPVLGTATGRRVIDAALSMERVNDVRTFASMLRV
jgi:2-methylcitrate dehydratase PrpD